MSKLYDFQELVDITGLPERTVRYYLAKVLDAPGGTRGRKAFYAWETLDQLKLAKQVLMAYYDPKRGEVKPSLMDFKNWLSTLSTEDIHTMVEMPYSIKPKMLLEIASPLSEKMQTAELDASYSIRKSTESWSSSEEDKKKTTDTAAQYLNRVMGSAPEPRSHRQRQWQSFRFGDDLEIKTRERLTPEQTQQLNLAGQLLQSVLKGR